MVIFKVLMLTSQLGFLLFSLLLTVQVPTELTAQIEMMVKSGERYEKKNNCLKSIFFFLKKIVSLFFFCMLYVNRVLFFYVLPLML